MSTTTLARNEIEIPHHVIKAVQHGKVVKRWFVAVELTELSDEAKELAAQQITQLAKGGKAEAGYFDLLLTDAQGQELDSDILIA